jgi:peptidoglycan hydrolase-like protein with peptidoglycan-binding domain
LDGRDALKMTMYGDSPMSARLRFGSNGEIVETIQKKLQDLDYYEERVNGDFGTRTLHAVLEFQTNAFGPNADDGIVGPMTASALGIEWPDL